MKTTFTLFILAGLLLTATVKAQTTTDYFVVRKDTTFCTGLNYTTTIQGYLKTLNYKTLDGEEVSLEGRKNVPDVLTFYISSKNPDEAYFVDKTPLKANKPDGYIRYTERAVDGKLKVYLAQQGYNSTVTHTPCSPHGDWSTGGPTGIYRFYLKMPNKTYYKINNAGNMKKYIKPYLLRCKEFKSQYKGDFSTREEPFMEMIRLYNSLCD